MKELRKTLLQCLHMPGDSALTSITVELGMFTGGVENSTCIKRMRKYDVERIPMRGR